MSGEAFHRGVRLSAHERDLILRRLDEAALTPISKQGRRSSPRLVYQMTNVGMVVEHPAGGEGRFLVCTRNLSSGGISFLHGGFLHPGAEVQMLLPKLDGQKIVVLGRIASCRFLGTRVHEVGVAFYDKIDPADFVNNRDATPSDDIRTSMELPSLAGDVLCLAPDEMDAGLIDYHLRNTGLHPAQVKRVGEAIDRIKRQPVDLVVVAFDDVSEPGVDPVDSLRDAGHEGPILTLSTDHPPVRSGEVDAVVGMGKPFAPLEFINTVNEMLTAAGAGEMERTIISELDGEEGMSSLIGQYVEHVRASVRLLEDATERGDTDRVRALCRSLAGAASGYGFPLLTEAARRAVRTLDATGDLEIAGREFQRIAEISRRMRPARDAA